MCEHVLVHVCVCACASWLEQAFFLLVIHFCPFLPPVFPHCRFMKSAPMFLDRNFKHLTKVTNFLPPFGFKTQGKKYLRGQVGSHLVLKWKCLEVHSWNCFLSRSRQHFISLIWIHFFFLLLLKSHAVCSAVGVKYRTQTYTHRVIQNDPRYSFGLKGQTPTNL